MSAFEKLTAVFALDKCKPDGIVSLLTILQVRAEVEQKPLHNG